MSKAVPLRTWRKRVRHCVTAMVNAVYATMAPVVSAANTGPHLYASSPARGAGTTLQGPATIARVACTVSLYMARQCGAPHWHAPRQQCRCQCPSS